MHELLQGIRLLKLYAWEELYCRGIEAVRARELASLFKITAAIIGTSIGLKFCLTCTKTTDVF